MDLKHAPISGILTAKVNGYLTARKNHPQRSKCRPMILREILERIERRLEAVGLEPAVASVRAGLSKDAIRNIKRKVNQGEDEDAGTSTSTLIKLAPVLNTTAAWLLEGVEHGQENMPPSMRRLWAAVVAAANTSPDVQDRIAEFAEYQISRYAKSREIATNPEA